MNRRTINMNTNNINFPLKFFSYGPAFRYERPQKGRQRQFNQIDAEILGVEGPGADIEIITLGAEVLHDLGVLDRCVLDINTLGDANSRSNYRDALVAYFLDYKNDLSEDSRYQSIKWDLVRRNADATVFAHPAGPPRTMPF